MAILSSIKKGIRGIYKITSPSGRIYIGQSVDIYFRWNAHLTSKKVSTLFHSIKKYGANAHKFEVIHEISLTESQDYINKYECFYIELYSSFGFRMMNIKSGGSNGALSEETKLKISKSLKGKQNTLGKKLSQEHKEKIRVTSTGRKASPLMIQKLIERNKSKKGCVGPRLGSKMSEEHKEKLRKLSTGRKLSPESILKREARRKINRKKAVWSEEARKKMSEWMKIRRAIEKQGGLNAI